MSPTDFEIKILRQHWINDDGLDDVNDLCSHGEAFIRIGSEVLSDKSSGSWSLSTAGLYLLRSLEQDCKLDEFSNQLVPCCGFSIYPSDDVRNHVLISGCPSGVDWKISHLNRKVTFESEKGSKAELSFDEYKKMILEFTDEIEGFYGDPKDKAISDDKLDNDGFNQFWSEWMERKYKWK